VRVHQVNFYRYALPFRQPLDLAGKRYRRREGLLVRLVFGTGAVGWGDIAPLPGWSPDSLDRIVESLPALRNALPGLDVSAREWPSIARSYASLSCGLEMALQGASGACRGRASQAKLPVNGLLAGTLPEMKRDAARMVAEGYTCVKLKVGGWPVADAVARVRDIRSIVGDQVALRLDANRAWSLEEAVRFGQAVAACNIAYVEEPTQVSDAFGSFYEQTGIPVALDETLSQEPGFDIASLSGLRALVLKPMLLGGLETARSWAARGRAQGLQVVVSSVFESGVGVRALARFAYSAIGADTAVGLDPYRWLATDVLRQPIDMTGGAIDISTWEADETAIDFTALHEVL